MPEALECQLHMPLKHLAVEDLHFIVNPWPFRVWAIDGIGEIFSNTSRDIDTF